MQSLNHPQMAQRLSALRSQAPQIKVNSQSIYVNNHIHTIYSFSPYSPTMALYKAQEAGLATAGIMDHDSVSGAREFIEAGKIIGMATTCGVECRVSMLNSPFADRRINNPDQIGNAYATIHGIPHQNLDMVEDFLRPLRTRREERNKKMTTNLNKVLASVDITLDYDKDIRPLSQAKEGGSVTERHICYAAAVALISKYGKTTKLTDALSGPLGIKLDAKKAALLSDESNPFLDYDLLGLLKSDLVQSFFIPATDECPDVSDYVDIAHKAGGIAAYAYLGDVGNSITGDKKAQTFEDSYLDELAEYLVKVGFDAITYMPTRNTMEQIHRVQALCDKYGFFQVSGEDINSPRQSFICPALEKPEFAHLRTATWALIGHEMAATENLEDGMFSQKTRSKYPDLQERIDAYAAIGKGNR